MILLVIGLVMLLLLGGVVILVMADNARLNEAILSVGTIIYVVVALCFAISGIMSILPWMD